MALIKCPDCGKEISDKAKNCIHCGCPIEESKSSTNEKETNKVEEKEVIPADTNKTENEKRIGKTLLIVAVMAIFLIGVFKSIPNKGEKIELPVALEGEAGLKEITYDEYKEKIKLKKPLLVTVINSEDKYSEDYLSVVKKILNIYRIPINYIDISKIDDKDINIFLNSNKSFSVQPSTTLMSGRKELNSIKGVIEKEELINFIKENIIVEEDTRTPQEKIVDYIKDKKHITFLHVIPMYVIIQLQHMEFAVPITIKLILQTRSIV